MSSVGKASARDANALARNVKLGPILLYRYCLVMKKAGGIRKKKSQNPNVKRCIENL